MLASGDGLYLTIFPDLSDYLNLKNILFLNLTNSFLIQKRTPTIFYPIHTTGKPITCLTVTDYSIRAGNEPDLLAVYLFNYVGRADLTQKVILMWLYTPYSITVHLQYSRWLVEEKYTTAPSGIPGNDDYGMMGSYQSTMYAHVNTHRYNERVVRVVSIRIVSTYRNWHVLHW